MHYSDDDEKHVKVLFFSGGKDSFLAIRAVLRSAEKARRKICLILLTTFDATSRVIAHQDMHIDTIIKQASHMNLPLIGVPVIRASKESYVSRINRALDLIANYCGGRKRILSLVFGDLFLDHIRSWREKEMKQLGCILEFPLWKVPYELLLDDLKLSGIDVVLSASTRNGIQVGDKFDHDFLKRIKSSDSSIDLFGENGEFHTIAKVWVVSKQQALGT
jgi:ATP-binding cassette subfamily B (MDR/TAP) protein 1